MTAIRISQSRVLIGRPLIGEMAEHGELVACISVCHMRTVRAGASDDELLECVRDWVALLAGGDFAAAVEFLVSPEGAYAPGRWTAEDLEAYLANYGSWEPLDDSRIMRVTPIESAVGELAPRFEVVRGDRLPAIEFDLPLNGECSDLTAMFDLAETADGRWGFLLYDLHVL